MPKVTKNIMLQGTGSHVGKSVLTAALLRCLRDRGISAAPFKAQNMALNSAVSADGGEIGRAQAFQAEAAGVDSIVHMNPVLLKPTGEARSQVVIQGKVHSVMSAAEYHAFKPEAMRSVLESYRLLAAAYGFIVIEGAGSPAEINLREGDIANMGIAEAVDSPVILVGDIDRGGVFASLVGTLELLSASERERVKGFIINKFRGDISLLAPGLEFLEKKTGKKVLGVVPHLGGLSLPDEDSVALDCAGRDGGSVRVCVVKLPRISNFTDFDPFRADPRVRLCFAEAPSGLDGAALVVIPGSKNTIEDLEWLRARGFAPALSAHLKKGGMLVGVCGGFQMLGRGIKDPFGVESASGGAEGLGLLDCETVLGREKMTFRVSGRASFNGREHEVEGYEIHMGETSSAEAAFACLDRQGAALSMPDGAMSASGLVIGTYVHGIFDNDGFREAVLARLGATGLGAPFTETTEASLRALARLFEEHVSVDEVLRIAGA